MVRADALWGFVEQCRNAISVSEVAEKFLGEMERLGFAHVALASHVDPVRPPPEAVMILRYPHTWVEHFSAERYQDVDPIFLMASRLSTPFQWDDPAFRLALEKPQTKVLDEAAEAGLADGFTIPIRGPDALPASCSLVPGREGVDPLDYPLAHSMAVFAHETARRLVAKQIVGLTKPLTRRERQFLTLAARGKSNWTISQIAGLSERHVHHTLERAKRRLGVATRQQAIVRALFLGEISIYEVAN